MLKLKPQVYNKVHDQNNQNKRIEVICSRKPFHTSNPITQKNKGTSYFYMSCYSKRLAVFCLMLTFQDQNL